MTRLERKNRTDIVFKGCGGLFDLFDDAVKEVWRIDDEQYNYLCEYGSEDVLGAMVSAPKNFTEAKQQLTLINTCLSKYVKEENS